MLPSCLLGRYSIDLPKGSLEEARFVLKHPCYQADQQISEPGFRPSTAAPGPPDIGLGLTIRKLPGPRRMQADVRADLEGISG